MNFSIFMTILWGVLLFFNGVAAYGNPSFQNWAFVVLSAVFFIINLYEWQLERSKSSQDPNR